MGSKPLRDLFEDASDKAEEIFGDDTKLQSTQTWTPPQKEVTIEAHVL